MAGGMGSGRPGTAAQRPGVVKRGTLCWVDLRDAAPPEMGKRRPAVVVSNSAQNVILDSVVVLPLSTQPPEIWPLRIHIGRVGRRESYAVLPGIRQISKARIIGTLGLLPSATIRNLDDAMHLYLND